MSFLEAVRAIGERELKGLEKGPLSDIDSFTQMPMELIDPKKKATRLPGQEIRIILDVQDPSETPLRVEGIRDIVLANFFAGDGDDREKKRRYLYREPVSPGAKWRWSPLYKLGKGVVNAQHALVGKGGKWKEDKNSRFYKLYNSTLLDFEKRGVFSKDSADRIMEALVANVDRLAGLWSDKGRSYLLLFGLSDGGRFLYPADVPAFRQYFLSRRLETLRKAEKEQGKKSVPLAVSCGLCHADTKEKGFANLDQIFAFSTFDKKSFLPGLDSSDASMAKVLPICDDCYHLLSEGRNVIDEKFLDTSSIYGVRIYTVPELVGGNDDLGVVGLRTRAFLRNGLRHERFLSKRVLKCGNGLVYHFLFWEKNQAQERILLMVEDVPPSRLEKLQSLWGETVVALDPFKKGDDQNSIGGATLWQAVNVIRRTMLELGSKNKGDVNVLKNQLLGLLGCLLRGERVDVLWVKEAIVSRLQGLCADADWAQRYGTSSARLWSAIVDFLHRANDGLKPSDGDGSRSRGEAKCGKSG